jgi:hypothetical protein
MISHAVRLVHWVDADNFLGYYVVWDGERVYQLASGSPRSLAELQRSFPNVHLHLTTMIQRGNWIEPNEELVRLMLGYPEFFEVLKRYYLFSPIDWEDNDPRMAVIHKAEKLVGELHVH